MGLPPAAARCADAVLCCVVLCCGVLWHTGDMYLARFLLDEVPDSEDHEQQQQQVSDRSSQKQQQQQSPNNTQFVSWEQNQSSR